MKKKTSHLELEPLDGSLYSKENLLSKEDLKSISGGDIFEYPSSSSIGTYDPEFGSLVLDTTISDDTPQPQPIFYT